MENQTDIKISIPKPCHEDWNKMTPNEKGAFCMKCAKTVVDFTKKTTDEIKDFLIEQSGKKICGRFMSDQLDEKPKKLIDIQIPIHLLPKRLSFNKAFVFALFIAFGTTLFSCSTTQGEVVGKISPIDTTSLIESRLPVEHLTGDTVYSVERLLGEPSIEPTCVTKGDVAVEKVGEVMAMPIDTVKKQQPDTLKEEEIKVGKIKIK